MDLIEKIKQIERIDDLIRRKATGPPKNLSSKLGISERQVYNIISTMKDMGAPIYYCPVSQSYCYQDSVSFRFGFISCDSSSLKNIRGGNGLKIFYLQNLLNKKNKILNESVGFGY